MVAGKKIRYILVLLVCIGMFLLVYSPHFNYKFPLHIDEWHAITESVYLENGEYKFQGRDGIRTMGFEIGFHFILMLLSYLVDLIFFYQFLPAIWAVVSGLVLFFVVFGKTKNYWIALLSMIFFASIKSNVNIAGLWFFTPLSFAIPFIFLYVYFFTEGIEKHNKKFILISLGIMVFLLFVHAVSVLFAVGFLVIYSLLNYKYLKKEYKFFLIFLLIPLIGLVFYSYMEGLNLVDSFFGILEDLQFKHGWGVLEVKNSFFELYSFIGYVFAIIGAVVLLSPKYKKYWVYLLWPVSVLVLIFIFRVSGISYISPYQRNLYYFAISLAFLSGVGVYVLLKWVRRVVVGFFNEMDKGKKELIKKIAVVIVLILILFFAFSSYYDVPRNLRLYKVIDEGDYQDLVFLSGFEKSKVMAGPFISTALYSISGHEPVGSIFFYGDRKISNEFFSSDCSVMQEIIDKEGVGYVISKRDLGCGWEVISDKKNYVYRVGE